MLGPASSLPELAKTPRTVPFSQWRFHGWTLKATCANCNHSQDVHMGMILKTFGEQASFNDTIEQRLRELCKCIRCGERYPKLEVKG